jgi:sugar lactone lactonase YvrE
MIDYTIVHDVRDGLGEGPIWSHVEQRLYWIDWQNRLVRRYPSKEGTVEQWHIGETVAGVVPRVNGGLVLALGSGFYFFDPKTKGLERIAATHEGEGEVELNDLRCDRKGRLWGGSYHIPQRKPLATLFRVDSDLKCHRMPVSIIVANGLAFSPDGTLLYYSDSEARKIFVCPLDVDDGRIGNPKVFAEIDGLAVPHGSSVDAQGFLWNAEFNRGCITCYAPDGRIRRRVTLPVSQPTACCFGGPKLDVLYVTTARWKMDEARASREVYAGALFAMDVSSRGTLEGLFNG